MQSPPTHEQAVLRLARTRRLLRARDLASAGLPTIALTRLVSAGKLERVARGVYSLPDREIGEHRSLAEVAIRVPRGVVCLLSALRVHDIGTQAPHEVWLAIPQGMPTPRIRKPALRVIRMSDATLAAFVMISSSAAFVPTTTSIATSAVSPAASPNLV